MAIRLDRKTLTTWALTQKLNAIGARGDRDEGSSKHVGYTLAALIRGKQWDDENRDYTSYDYLVENNWKEIQSVRNYLGIKEFTKLVHSTPWGIWADHCRY